jgi:hypothetical protein
MPPRPWPKALVGAVCALDLVKARPASYVIQPACVAHVDTVGVLHPVVAAATLEVVLPVATHEAVVPVGSEEPILTAVPVSTFAVASCPAKNAPSITTITVSKKYSRFILPLPESTWSSFCRRKIGVVFRGGVRTGDQPLTFRNPPLPSNTSRNDSRGYDHAIHRSGIMLDRKDGVRGIPLPPAR